MDGHSIGTLCTICFWKDDWKKGKKDSMRRIKQIAGSDNRIYALCEDGTLWEMNHSGEWTQHPGIPGDGSVHTSSGDPNSDWFGIFKDALAEREIANDSLKTDSKK